MFDGFLELLRRQTRAAVALEARLRALELVVGAGEQRFLSLALDEVETAAEQLSSLELSRSLVIASAGLSADITARQLIEALADHDERAVAEHVVEELRGAMLRLADARARADAAVRSASSAARQRSEVAAAFAAV